MKAFCKVALFMLLAAICIGFAGCGADGKIEKGTDLSVVDGKTFHFLSREEQETLREPLIKLLSNELSSSYEGADVSYESADTDSPSIAQGYGCGLFDVTADGMPELLVFPKGYTGSSATTTYFIYDILSGKKLGEINGGACELWAYYYCTETEELRAFGSYWLRNGWTGRGRFLAELKWNGEASEYYSDGFIYSDHEIDSLQNEQGELAEICTGVRYYIDGKEVHIDDYYSELDNFHRENVLIPETTLRIVMWNQISSSDEDRVVRAEKMAEALLASEQRFIVPAK